MPNDHGKTPNIIVAEELDPADVAVITDSLRANYVNQVVHYDFHPLVVFVRDPQTGKVDELPLSAETGPRRDRRRASATDPQLPFAANAQDRLIRAESGRCFWLSGSVRTGISRSRAWHF